MNGDDNCMGGWLCQTCHGQTMYCRAGKQSCGEYTTIEQGDSLGTAAGAQVSPGELLFRLGLSSWDDLATLNGGTAAHPGVTLVFFGERLPPAPIGAPAPLVDWTLRDGGR